MSRTKGGGVTFRPRLLSLSHGSRIDRPTWLMKECKPLSHAHPMKGQGIAPPPQTPPPMVKGDGSLLPFPNPYPSPGKSTAPVVSSGRTPVAFRTVPTPGKALLNEHVPEGPMIALDNA